MQWGLSLEVLWDGWFISPIWANQLSTSTHPEMTIQKRHPTMDDQGNAEFNCS